MISAASTVAAVRRAIRADGLFDGCRCLLLGVSGGGDSVAMAHLLHRVTARGGPKLAIAHLHHGIRGVEADRDEAFARKLAGHLGVEFIGGRADVLARVRAGRGSVEMAARQARHEFFRSAAARCGADRVALAHTADDQAETVLMRLCRGAGSAGLSAMASDATVGGLRIVRPLLRIGRAALEGYLRARGLRWRTDASNRDPRHQRNRVRARILPALEKEMNPAVREALRTAAEILGAEDALLDAMAVRARARVQFGSDLDAAGVARLPVAIQRRVVRTWLRLCGTPEPANSFASTERIRALASGSAPSVAATLGAGWRVVKRYGRLKALAPADEAAAWAPRALKVQGRTPVPEAGVVFSIRRDRGFRRQAESGPGAGDTTAWIDARRIGDAGLTVRPWRAGDRYRPLGAPGAAKIHDILVDAKIDRDLRPGLPVVECGGVIVWFPGHRIAEGWQVRTPDAPSLRIGMRRDRSRPR